MRNPVLKTISRAKGKLQLERLVKGVAILIAFLLLGSFLFTFVLARNNFSDSALLLTRTGGLLGALFLFGYYIFRPLWNSPSKRRVARFLEERYPQLKERVSTAVEIETTSTDVHPELRRLIQQDARKQLGRIPQPRLYHRRRSLASLVVLFSSLAIFTFLLSEGARGLPLQSEQIAAMV